ncbi:MAG: prepilin peptidase [Bacillota bacterium]
MLNYIIFIFGLIIGSFLNVVIYRLPQDKSVIFTRSNCPNCQMELGVLDLIPILSFIIMKGRCRYCNTKISYQYPVVELVTGLVFLLLFQQYQLSIELLIYLLLSSLLIVSAVIDFKHQIIPNQITYTGIIVGLIFSVLFNHLSFISAFWGLIIPAGFLFLITIITKGGVGMGDIKLVGMIGTYIGAKSTMMGIFLGSLIGSMIGLLLIGLKVVDWKERVPFGPFLALGNLVMVIKGQVIIRLYLELIS